MKICSSPLDLVMKILIKVLQSVQPKVTNEMNSLLTIAVSDFEILDAVQPLNPEKASGPDGYPSAFFKKYWHITGKDVLSAVKAFF